jgi:hypothetical protein
VAADLNETANRRLNDPFKSPAHQPPLWIARYFVERKRAEENVSFNTGASENVARQCARR